MIAEFLPIAVRCQVVAQPGVVIATVEEARGLAIEAQDVADHPVERRREQVAALGEQRVQRGAVVFQSGFLAAHAETHRTGLGFNPEFIHQGDEIRVGPVVEDDEAGIDGPVPAAEFDVVGMGVAADMVAGLEDGDVMAWVQAMGRREAGDAGADDGQPHDVAPASMRRPSRTWAGRGLRSQTRPRLAISRRA